MNLRNFGIGTRLGVGYVCILLAAAAMLLIAQWGASTSRRSLQDTTLATATQSAQLTQLQQSLLLSALSVRSMGLQSTVEGVQKDQAEAKKNREAYLGLRKQLGEQPLSPESQAVLAELDQIDKRSEEAFHEAVELAAQFNTEQAAQVILKKMDPMLADSLKLMNQLGQQQQTAAAATMAEVDARHSRTVAGIAAAGLLVLGFVGLLGWRLTASIVGPLREAVAAAARVSQGDLVTEVKVSGRDEAAQLLEALNGMKSSLAGMVRSVREGTETIGVASGEIAQGNADLSLRTESQASALQETASSVQSLAQVVEHNAGNAEQALGLAREASEQSDAGHEAVARVVETMGEIQGHSRKINDIISVINGIAFQTNILALNAAVEAARAGEQGRGFAVVASEVRTLSQRTTAASKEIEGLIRAAVQSSETGVQLVGSAGQAIAEVRDSVRRVSRLVEEISTGSQAQSQGIGEVNQAIGSIDQVTQQNAALVEQAAAAAASMRQQTERLNQTVSAFTV